MSLGDVLRYNLLLEGTADQTAQEVYESNTLNYGSSADVPAWMFQSFSTILGCTSSELSGRIIANEGEAKTPSKPCIVVEMPEEIESVMVKDAGLRSDQPGTVTCYVKIFVKNLVTDKDITRVTNCLNKIWYVLDGNMRQYGIPARYTDLEINTNEFVDGSEFRCYYCRHLLPIASEGQIDFNVIAEYNFGLPDV